MQQRVQLRCILLQLEKDLIFQIVLARALQGEDQLKTIVEAVLRYFREIQMLCADQVFVVRGIHYELSLHRHHELMIFKHAVPLDPCDRRLLNLRLNLARISHI